MVLEVHVSRDTVFEIFGARVTHDVEIGSQGGGDVVVGRDPVTGNSGTVGIGDDVCTVPLQNG